MMALSRAARCAPFVLAASTLAAFGACGQLLNTDGVVIEVVAPPTDGEECEPDSFRCEGAALRLCEATRAFRTVRVCSTPALCCASPEQCGGQPGCLPPTCMAGERRCTGEVLEECNADQTGYVAIDRCASALQCNASLGRCTDQPCDWTQRERQCSGPQLEQCLPGAAVWIPTEACATAGLCDPSADTCAPLDCRIGGLASPPSPYQCVGGNLMRCNDGLTGWEHVETCLNPSNCNALIDPLAGDPYAVDMSTEELASLGCSPPACAPGRYRCEGATLYLCGINRTGYLDRIQTCQSPRHCDAEGGRCLDAPCIVGQRQCSGDEFQTCTESGWVTNTTCSRGAPCDSAQGCLPTSCEPNEYRCQGAVLERCNVERTGWIPVKACDSAALCSVTAKRCEAPACTTGEVRCTTDGRLERCNAERTGWALVAECAAGIVLPPGVNGSALCDPTGAGQCLRSTSCLSGALRCNGRELERCRDGAWRPHARCATAAQCDATGSGACRAALCEPGSYRCVVPGTPPTPADDQTPRLGLALEVCNDDGTGFVPALSCSPAELCDDTHGQCDICEPSQLLCSDRELLVCTADGQERTLYKVCAQGCVEARATPSNRTTCREDVDVSGG
ncbi:MAG TPA: hypothetical protein VNN80_17995 [Polyangiaceae bacterium]|nr:hypothetical protein [Polyangiaceae bacterium]